MWASIIAKIVEVLIKSGLNRKKEADAEKVVAVEKTLESVGESTKLEKEIRDEQKAIDKSKSDVTDESGGLNFDDFNSGK